MKELALRIFAVIFLLVSLLHLMRLILKVPLVVGSCSIPMYTSAFGFIIAFLLGIWGLSLAKK